MEQIHTHAHERKCGKSDALVSAPLFIQQLLLPETSSGPQRSLRRSGEAQHLCVSLSDIQTTQRFNTKTIQEQIQKAKTPVAEMQLLTPAAVKNVLRCEGFFFFFLARKPVTYCSFFS